MTVTELKLFIHDTVDTSSSTFSDARMVRGMNVAQDDVVNAILAKDNFDQYDDPNWGDINEGYLNITATNVFDYSEDENFANILFISKVWILPSATATEYVEVEKQGKDFSLAAGTPCKYRLSGKKIIFDLTFNYTATNGILIQFVRAPKPIEVADTTKEIGIPTTFHKLIGLITAYYYALAKTLTSADRIANEIMKEEKKLGIAVMKQSNNLNVVLEAEYINAI